MSKKNYSGSGARSDNETSKELSSVSFSRKLNTIKINDAYRKYMLDPPTDSRPMTFLEFKNHYIGINRKKSKRPKKKSKKS